MQHYIYKLNLVSSELARNPNAWTAAQIAIVEAHFQYLQQLIKEGIVLLAGRTDNVETGFGIVLYKADSETAATAIMQNDPAVKAELMCAELHLFRLALWGQLP